MSSKEPQFINSPHLTQDLNFPNVNIYQIQINKGHLENWVSAHVILNYALEGIFGNSQATH